MKKDVFYQLPSDSLRFGEWLSDKLDFIENEQLLDTKLWSLLVEQFRVHSDDRDGGWRGEFWGKLMRGGCFVYSCTHNPELYKTLEATVIDVLSAQDADGRIASVSKDNEFKNWDLWCRKYVILGLQYFLEICKNKQLKLKIVSALVRHTDYIVGEIGCASEGKTEITDTSRWWGAMNSCSLLEPIVRMYNLTGRQKYLDFATYIVSSGGCSEGNIFELAFEGRLYPYQYPVTKAYEMMSCFEGLIEYYRVTGEEKWHIAAKNFVRMLIKSDITVIGCAGCSEENFDNSACRQLDTTEKRFMQETCVTVTWMKLCFQLLRLSGDPVLADRIEQSAYNALLGALNTERGVSNHGLPFDSYSPLLSNVRGRAVGGRRAISDGEYYGCCAAIGAAGIGLIGLSAIMRTDKGAVINLYTELAVSFMTPKGQTGKITVNTDYPKNGKISIVLANMLAEKFELSLRIPSWSKHNFLMVNSESIDNIAQGSYCNICRIWKSGDTVELNLDMNVYQIKPDSYGMSNDLSKFVAFRRGPLVLARDVRLGQNIDETVSVKTDFDGAVKSSLTDNVSFKNQIACDIYSVSGNVIHTVDYASAGKSWDENSRMATWLPSCEAE